MRVLFLVTFFLLFGAFFLVSNGNLHLNKSDEFFKFGEIYYSWIGEILGNVKTLTGYVAKFEWLPEKNSTINIQ